MTNMFASHVIDLIDCQQLRHLATNRKNISQYCNHNSLCLLLGETSGSSYTTCYEVKLAWMALYCNRLCVSGCDGRRAALVRHHLQWNSWRMLLLLHF